MRYPDRFAALAPLAGYAKTDDVCNLKHMPIWVFHGQKDSNVYIQYSEQLVRALKACGNDVRFTIYPDAEHDNSTWKPTYENPELYTWFLEHTKRVGRGR